MVNTRQESTRVTELAVYRTFVETQSWRIRLIPMYRVHRTGRSPAICLKFQFGVLGLILWIQKYYLSEL